MLPLITRNGFVCLNANGLRCLITKAISSFVSIPVLTRDDVLQQKAVTSPESQGKSYLAFYSSVYGGIVTDEELMTIPIDDHFVHRGHAVFDTATVRNGSVYQLQQHLDRFVRSAKGCRIWHEDTEFLNKDNLRSIILDTIRVAGQKDQNTRFYLGAGRGAFSISNRECKAPTFYVISIAPKQMDPLIYERGIEIITTTVPMKPPPFSTLKTTNYIQNAVGTIEAEDDGFMLLPSLSKCRVAVIVGAQAFVWVDGHGHVAESAIANIGFMLKGVLTVPKFSATLAGISVQRMMHLARTQLNIKVEQRDIHVSEGKASEEAFLFGGATGCVPIVRWDGEIIGNGTPGKYAREMLELYRQDVLHGHGDSDQLIAIEELR